MTHDLSRRSFVKGSALACLGAAAASSGALSMFASVASAEEAPEEKIVWTHCAVNCGCCCAWKCHVVDGVITYIETDDTGSPEFGQRQLRACGRGRSARRWLQSPDRLNYPLKRVEGTKRGDGVYEQISWDEALDTIAGELRRCIDTYGPEGVDNHYASGVTSSQIGGGPVNRLLNMAGGHMNWYGSYSSAAIAQAGTYTYGGGTYGSNFLTLQDNELVVLFGNAVTEGRPGGCGHTYDLAVMREQHNCRIISIDPRYTDTICGQGGEWIPIRPGTDGALVAALAYELINNEWVDEEFLHTYCVGYDEETLPESAKGQNLSYKDYVLGTGYDMVPKTPAWASEITQIPEQRIIDLARELHEANPVYIAQGYGINRRANGEIAARAIMLLPQLLGQIGKPGMNDGRREGSVSMGIGSFPAGENPVTISLPTYEWPNYIDHGTELTALNAGLKGADKSETSLKFMFNYGGNCITNQHGDINGTHDLMADDTKCEFVVTSEIFMTDSAKYSDIIIPDLTIQEQVDISNDGYSDNMKAAFFGQPVYEPQFERRGIYEVCCDLAERLGFGEEFSEGKTREDWCRELYEAAREKNENLPTWEDGVAMGVYKEDPPEKIFLKEFIEDPEANPLNTPSGKIEIYSERLAEFAATWELADDEVISPIPLFDPGANGYTSLTEEYPLLISGFQSKAHTHSSYANNEIIASVTTDSALINPIDAEERGIVTGDQVRIFNHVGEMRLPALVTPRVIPGTVCVPAGVWHDADMAGDRIDYGGCPNTISEYRPTPLGKCNPNHSNIGQVLKA